MAPNISNISNIGLMIGIPPKRTYKKTTKKRPLLESND